MTDKSKALLEELIKGHIDPKGFNDEEVVKKAASLFLFLSDGFIKRASHETFYLLPYKDIFIYLFANDFEFKSETFSSFISTVFEEMQKQPEFDESPYSEYLEECYNKFTQHISLAQVQKHYIVEVTKRSKEAADEAISAAEHAKEMQKDMMVNYITILGIFASIIITIFGGMQIISATSKLLQTSIKLPTLVMVLTLLALLIVIILGVLLSWVNSIRHNEKDVPALSYAIIFLASVLALSGTYIYVSNGFDQGDSQVFLPEEKEK
ncbi:hypothetical protein ABEF81_08550 [Acinetobacter thermotolerans]|uniref:hypothetical protein n=1 Tax=Acinetobacter thermotolerans TaxID=3151487 RepID=UPI00325B0EF9